MFTAAVFKELLFPLIEDIKDYFIYLPLKNSSDFNFSKDIKYFLEQCGIAKETYNAEINKLNSTRKQIISGFNSQTEMFHYFLELEQICERFTIKNMFYMQFSWTDSFNQNVAESQKSIAFEKSNILYNIASKFNNQTLESIKVSNFNTSVRDLCISASIFDWISNGFANPPLSDIQPEFTKFLSCICLIHAQELAFFISLKEEKGIKILARMSLGLMNLIQSAKELSNSIGIPSWLNQKLENKVVIHTFIHCLIMAEFWDGEELYEIASDLYSASKRTLEKIKIHDNSAILDYLTIAIIRSGKERQNISYEGKNPSDSKVKLEPYYIANVLDFKQILLPYISSYAPLFKNIYPLKIIEAQSEFEAKSNTILKTLERASEEVAIGFEDLSMKFLCSVEVFIIEVRSKIIGCEDHILKKSLNEIDNEISCLNSYKNGITFEEFEYHESRKINDKWIIFEKTLTNLDSSKARVILNDNAFIQTASPFVKEIHFSYMENLKSMLSDCEENTKIELKLYEQLKNAVNSNIEMYLISLDS